MKRTLKKLMLSLAALLCVWSLALPVFADVIVPPSDGLGITIEATQTEAATEAAAEVVASTTNPMFLYLGIGAAVIVVGLILFLLLRKKA